MKRHLFTFCCFLACALSGCTPLLDDVSQVPEADREGLQKCLDAPDLAGNHWPAGSAKARCWLSLPQEPSLRDIASTLNRPGGAATLDHRYAQILAAHHKDPAHREFLFTAYQDFRTAEGRKLAADWLAKSPNSPYAQLAAGEAALAAAQKARGTAFAAKTSQAQFDGMDAQLRIAVPLLQSALQAEPRLSPACEALMEAGSMSSDESLRAPATRACMRVDPLSYHVNAEFLSDIDPRWGGSFQQVDQAIAQLARHVQETPMLGSLLGKGIGRRAYIYNDDDSRLAPIAAELERAALTAPDAFYLDRAGMAAEQAGQHQKALDYIGQAVRFEPRYANFLVDRAEVLMRLHREREALRDARHASAQSPDDCDCDEYAFTRLAVLLGELHEVHDEQRVLQKIVAFPHEHTWALTVLCQTYLGPGFDLPDALPCTRQLVTESPNDPEASYLRALALYSIHDPGAAEFDSRFRSLANTGDPVRRNEIQQLDELKGQSH